MSSKTPYEIRLELLAMAKDYLEQQQNLAHGFAQQAFAKAVQANVTAAEQWKTFIPESYSIDDILKKATELYGFVTKKD